MIKDGIKLTIRDAIELMIRDAHTWPAGSESGSESGSGSEDEADEVQSRDAGHRKVRFEGRLDWGGSSREPNKRLFFSPEVSLPGDFEPLWMVFTS